MINDRYKILRKAGEGRSKVFCCEDRLRNDREFAIKIIPSSVSKEEEKAFRDEFHLLQKLNHPNIINVFEFGTIVRLDEEDKESGISSGSKFFTLEYFDGKELYDFPNIKNESFLVTIICQISSVLYYLHQSAFIYYDLKSENILVKNINGQPVIKFIDFGLTSRINDNNVSVAKGTTQYIAPEILRNEKIDHRVDLYSFGILLYKIIYGKFPFSIPEGNSPNEQLAIYKAHLDGQFDFPETGPGDKIISIIKKLLSKDVEKRYYTSIGILEEIDTSNIKTHKNEWTRIPVFTARNDALSVISTYIEKGDRGEVLIVKGSEGAGKSTLLNELNYKFENSVLITAGQYNERYLWQSLLNKILYKDNIYRALNEETIQTGKEILAGRSQNFLEDLKALFIKLSSADDFTLLLDDFNLLSDFDLDIFMQLIPLLQINKIKIVITEDSGGKSHSSRINNLQFINLNPFTESQVAEFINKSFAPFFPGKEIRKTIIFYSDLLPGNIEEFLKDLIVLNLLDFLPDGPIMNTGVDFDKILKGTQEEIYQLRLNDLDEQFLEIAFLLSMININIDIITISGITGKSRQEILSILEKLSEANIIHQNTIQNSPLFTSQGIKEFIYASIEDKKQAHFELSKKIERNLLSFDSVELSRHLELAGEYERAYDALIEEIEKAEKASALAYEKSLLQHLMKLPLGSESLRKIKKDLADCLFKLGELNGCINLVDELSDNFESKEEELVLKILKGNALIDLKLLNEGRKLLESILPTVKDNKLKNEILAKIAEAEYQIAKYDNAEKIVDLVLKDDSTSVQTKGKIYQINGLIQLFNYNNPKETIRSFKKSLGYFNEVGQLDKVASMENNLANIYHILREKDKAEIHWKNALKLNSSIGDLQQQGGILINFGIFYFNNCNFDLAVEQYQKAKNILQAFGDKNYLGFTFTNLGEAQLLLCEYESAIVSLKQSIKIFDEIGVIIEKSEALFILAKLYFELGQKTYFLNILEDYKKNLELEGSKKLLDKFQYLKLLSELFDYNYIQNLTKLFNIRDNLKDNDIFNYCNLEIILIENFITLKQFDQALNEINDPEFLDISKENVYFKAYRNYLLGRISEYHTTNELEPAINYFIKAYEGIKDTSITELTLQIINSLYDNYLARGNTSKVKEYANYLNHLISYVSGQLSDEKLRETYLEKKNIKGILTKINKL
jgi:serine/threonine protein kinase/Tfp pilus assembly protein PilF